MDHLLYGNLGHGSSWKRCCGVIGALPIRCYNEKRAQYYQERHAEETKLSALYDTYMVGSSIVHPRYGIGVIEENVGESTNRYITVNFISVGRKKLGLAWVDKNCEKGL